MKEMSITIKDNVNANFTKVMLTDKNKTLIKGIFAGMFIATGGVAANIVSSTIASYSIAKLLGAIVFPIGLIMILMVCGDLFTGDCLAVNALRMKKIPKVRYLIDFLIFVWIANFIGSFLFANAAVLSGIFNGAVGEYTIAVAASKASSSIGKLFVSSIMCNIFVCAAVLFSNSAESTIGKVIGAFVPIFAFVLCGFEHCVANMFYMSAAFLLNGIGYIDAMKVIGVTTIGNIIGGAAFTLLMLKTVTQTKKS